jgi:hypothetical protein
MPQSCTSVSSLGMIVLNRPLPQLVYCAYHSHHQHDVRSPHRCHGSSVPTAPCNYLEPAWMSPFLQGLDTAEVRQTHGRAARQGAAGARSEPPKLGAVTVLVVTAHAIAELCWRLRAGDAIDIDSWRLGSRARAPRTSATFAKSALPTARSTSYPRSPTLLTIQGTWLATILPAIYTLDPGKSNGARRHRPNRGQGFIGQRSRRAC